jgi:AraC-like DNA-binding protein
MLMPLNRRALARSVKTDARSAGKMRRACQNSFRGANDELHENADRLCGGSDCSHGQAHLDGDLSLGALSGQAQISPFHFHRVFRGAVGETVKQYCQRLRLERAAHRLVLHEVTIMDVIRTDRRRHQRRQIQEYWTALECGKHRTPAPRCQRERRDLAGRRQFPCALQIIRAKTAPEGCLGQFEFLLLNPCSVYIHRIAFGLNYCLKGEET